METRSFVLQDPETNPAKAAPDLCLFEGRASCAVDCLNRPRPHWHDHRWSGEQPQISPNILVVPGVSSLIPFQALRAAPPLRGRTARRAGGSRIFAAAKPTDGPAEINTQSPLFQLTPTPGKPISHLEALQDESCVRCLIPSFADCLCGREMQCRRIGAASSAPAKKSFCECRLVDHCSAAGFGGVWLGFRKKFRGDPLTLVFLRAFWSKTQVIFTTRYLSRTRMLKITISYNGCLPQDSEFELIFRSHDPSDGIGKTTFPFSLLINLVPGDNFLNTSETTAGNIHESPLPPHTPSAGVKAAAASTPPAAQPLLPDPIFSLVLCRDVARVMVRRVGYIPPRIFCRRHAIRCLS